MKRLIKYLLPFLLLGTAYAGTIDLGDDFVFEAVISSSDMNTKLQTLETVINGNIDGNNVSSSADLTIDALVTTGNVDLGNATTDTITPTGRIDGDLDPNAAGTISLGSSSLPYLDVYTETLDVSDTGVSSNLYPGTDNSYDLGSSSLEWKDIRSDGVIYTDQMSIESIGSRVASAGDIWRNGASLLFSDGTDTTDLTNRKHVGTLTHYTISTTADVVGNLPFQPNYVALLAVVEDDPTMSIGFSDTDGTDTKNYSIYDKYGNTVNTWGKSNTKCIFLQTTASGTHSAEISSSDTDGFTLTWANDGDSSDSTVTIYYMAIE